MTSLLVRYRGYDPGGHGQRRDHPVDGLEKVVEAALATDTAAQRLATDNRFSRIYAAASSNARARSDCCGPSA